MFSRKIFRNLSYISWLTGRIIWRCVVLVTILRKVALKQADADYDFGYMPFSSRYAVETVHTAAAETTTCSKLFCVGEPERSSQQHVQLSNAVNFRCKIQTSHLASTGSVSTGQNIDLLMYLACTYRTKIYATRSTCVLSSTNW
ncbi:Hypothetical_protein [Hexamita inflata]|uniref:Hypothetical_protein n=1 Tax=Hexamita inflata TaxID=28002 RepID=A0ABP1J635_9EUKA